MTAGSILEEFLDAKMLSILKLFLFNEDKKYYLREISKKAKVPVATVFRYVKRLKELGVVQEEAIKKLKLYYISNNKDVDFLRSLLEEKRSAIEEFVDFTSKQVGVDAIAMHGEESRDRTNVVVIGSGIDSTAIKQKVGDIKEKLNFNIIELILDPVQFSQMSSMGFFTGKKVILWEKKKL
jgi:Fe2+ or Zn2+ uptake regulation protein